MRERVRHFGGTMNIESNQEGTRISFKFPHSKTEAPPEGTEPGASVQ
jgi:signal transduction histidine kinase